MYKIDFVRPIYKLAVIVKKDRPDHKTLNLTTMKKTFRTLTVILTFTLFIFIGSVRLYAQNFSGQIFDNKTKQPIPYVNIGIPNKGLGTVSDDTGNFSIQLDDKYNNDSLKISMIAYKPISLKVQDAKDKYGSTSAKFYMDENSYQLNEVVVRPIKYKTTIVGNKIHGPPCINFVGDSTQTHENVEVGTLINIKKHPAFVDNIKFGVCQNDFDSITFRVNIYANTNENILKHPIYVTVKKEDKEVTIDTKKYNIEVEDDFIIAFEALDIIKPKDGKGKTIGKRFNFRGGLFGDDMLYRKNIYSKWEKVSVLVLGFNATITYEDKGNWFTNIFN